jgi:nucleotide-binding universal stress UspA family protein
MATAFAQIVVASSVLGLRGGWVLTRFGVTIETSGELLLFVVVVLTGVAGSILALEGSVVLGTLVAGIYVANRAPWLADRLFAAVRTLEAPIYLVFFVIAGAGIHLDELRTVGVLGAGYAIARTVGKIAGAMLGGRAAHPSLPHGHALPLGLGLLPHAGMAIALVAFVVEQTPALGADVSGVVLGSIVIFELAGPLLLRRVLHKTGDAGRRNGAAAVDDVAAPGAGQRIEKIVIPVGNIRVALPRLPFLFSLVAHLDAELVVVHVSRPGTTESHRDVPDVLTLIQRLAEERDVRCEVRHCVSEHVASAIADIVRDEEADLLIMGEPSSPSMLQASGWGRTAQRVMRLVDVPILVYPVDPHDPGDVPAAYQKRAARISTD